MTKNIYILTLLQSLLTLTCYGQNPKSNSDKFMDFLNNYQTDSLRTLLDDNFQVKRTYVTFTNDKATFIDTYIPTSKNFNGKYIILNSSYDQRESEYLVEDRSDYFKYLKIDYPKWKIKLTVNEQSKIETMTIDSTETYQTYKFQMQQKDKEFEIWLATNYPNETKEKLYSTSGLILKRLKEYAEKHSR